MQLRKLIIYGKLRKFLKKSHFDVAANTPMQAVSFLRHNFPQVEKHMMNQMYKVKMGTTEITEDLLDLKGDGDIKIIPVATGSRKMFRGIGKVVAGAALIGIVVATGGFGGAMIGTFGLTGAIGVGTIATTIGANLIIGGVTEMITPVPKYPNFNASDGLSDQDPNVQTNFGFNSITNTSRAGVPVPILYGQVFTGSVVVSSGIDTVQAEGTA